MPAEVACALFALAGCVVGFIWLLWQTADDYKRNRDHKHGAYTGKNTYD